MVSPTLTSRSLPLPGTGLLQGPGFYDSHHAQHLQTKKIGPKLWILTADLHIGRFIVPRGFITDGASVPKILHSIMAPMAGPHAEAAVLHDFLYALDSGFKYTPGVMLRKDADVMFLRTMREYNVPWLRAKAAYRAVRIAGGSSYKKQFSREKISVAGYPHVRVDWMAA